MASMWRGNAVLNGMPYNFMIILQNYSDNTYMSEPIQSEIAATEPPSALGLMFFVTELFVFLSQIFIFFIVAAFSSDFLRNEDRLVEFATAKINAHTMPEIGLTLLAITVALGVLAFISRIASSTIVEIISNEVLNEAPRTIYFFGSTISATILAIAIFLSNHPQATADTKAASAFFGMSVGAAIISFAYGCGLSYLLKQRALKDRYLKPEAK